MSEENNNSDTTLPTGGDINHYKTLNDLRRFKLKYTGTFCFFPWPIFSYTTQLVFCVCLRLISSERFVGRSNLEANWLTESPSDCVPCDPVRLQVQ